MSCLRYCFGAQTIIISVVLSCHVSVDLIEDTEKQRYIGVIGISNMATMRAVVLHQAGGPETLKVQEWPKPMPKGGQVLIRVRAFGVNRSEMFTRQ